MKWSERRVTLPLAPAPEAGASLLGYALINKLLSALNAASDYYFDRARSLSANRFIWGKWSSIAVSHPVFRFGRPACIYQHLCSIENWSPVRESHSPARFCRPQPGLLGQRDISKWECRLKSGRADAFAFRPEWRFSLSRTVYGTRTSPCAVPRLPRAEWLLSDPNPEPELHSGRNLYNSAPVIVLSR